MTPTQHLWLDGIAKAAEIAGHIFPTMAAAEAALESGYGTSLLERADHNLFGTKQHAHPIYGTHNIPTREFSPQHGWFVVNAAWISYPSDAASFADRMATLKRLASSYKHYAAALAAPDAVTYVNEVSQTWSTDPARAAKVITIHNAYIGA